MKKTTKTTATTKTAVKDQKKTAAPKTAPKTENAKAAVPKTEAKKEQKTAPAATVKGPGFDFSGEKITHAPTKEEYREQALEWAANNGAKADVKYEYWFLFQQITMSNPNDHRAALKYCYSTGKYMIATDAKLLAIMPTTLPRGFYLPAVIGKGKKGIHNFTPVYFDQEYPDVFSVIPKANEHAKTVHTNFTVNVSLHAEIFALQFLLATAGEGLILGDAALDTIATTCAEFDCTFFNAVAPVMFYNGELEIIAMPVRPKDGDSQILKAIRSYRDQIRAAVKAGKEPAAIGTEE